MPTPELRKCPFCKQESLFWNSHSNIYECLNLKCKRKITADEFSRAEKELTEAALTHVHWHGKKSFLHKTRELHFGRRYLSGQVLLLLLLTLAAIGIMAYTYYHIKELARPVVLGIMVAAAIVALWDATKANRLSKYVARRLECGTIVTSFILIALIGCSAAAYTNISPLYEAKNVVVEWFHNVGSPQGDEQLPASISVSSSPPTSKTPTATPTPKSTPSQVINLSELERLTFSLINAKRTAQGLSPLQWSDSIASVARNHSTDMASHGYFAHEDLQGRDMGDRLQNAGVSWYMCAENICCVPAVKTYHYINGIQVSKDSYTMEQLAEEAVGSWMASPGHRVNILNAKYTYSGLGVGRGIQDGQDSFLFTQDFVSP